MISLDNTYPAYPSFLGSYVFNKLRDLYQYFLIKLKS